MTKTRYRMAAVGLALIGFATPTWAQPVRLMLADAVERGISASDPLAELKARQTAVEAVLAATQAERRPIVSLQGSFLRTNHIDEFGFPNPDGVFRVIFPDLTNNYLARLDLQWPIYTGGRMEALAQAAGDEAAASGHDLATARANTKLEVTRAYWALVTAIETEQVVAESTRRIDAHLRDMRSRLSAGVVPPNEVLTVEAEQSRQRALAIEAQSHREIAALTLRRLLGLGLATPLELLEPLDRLPPTGAPVESLVAAALEGRSDRLALATRLVAEASRIEAARAGFRPTVTVGGGFDYARPNTRILPRREAWEDSWDVQVRVSWPWLDGGRTEAAVAEAAAREQATRLRLDDFDSRLDVEVRQRRLELDAAIATVGAATDSVRSAAEARRVVGERFSVGVATSTDVLDAQVVLLLAELDRTRALANVRLNQARLDRALGR